MEEEVPQIPAMPSSSPPPPPITPSTSTEAEFNLLDAPKPDNNISQEQQLHSSPPTPAQRHQNFMQLRSYEAKRRSSYTQKYTQHNLLWRSHRDILTKAYKETNQLEQILTTTQKMNTNYKDYLQAIVNDSINDDYSIIPEKKLEHVQHLKKETCRHLGGDSKSYCVKHDNVEKHVEKLYLEDYNSLLCGNENDEKEESSFCEAVKDSYGSMARAFDENLDSTENMLSQMKKIKNDLDTFVKNVGAVGDATILQLKHAEHEVTAAWDSYYNLAKTLLLGDEEATADVVNHMPVPDGKHAKPVMDVWIVEMHYRIAVANLISMWEKSTQELTKVFTGIKEMETKRRVELRDILNTFMKQNQQMWTGIPSMMDSMIQALNDAPSDMKALEQDISNQVKSKALSIKAYDEEEKKKAENKVDMIELGYGGLPTKKESDNEVIDNGLQGLPEPEEGFVLQTPLESELLCKIQVVWAKHDKMMSTWKPRMAITTFDNFLHLMEVPDGENISMDASSEIAFNTLLPTVEVPTEDMISKGHLPNISSWYDRLKPRYSFDLKHSDITIRKPKKGQPQGDAVVDIKETTYKGRKAQTRKLCLKLKSNEEMVEWLLSLEHLGHKAE